MTDWGKALRVKARMNKITLEDVANKAGYARGYLSGLINGKYKSDIAESVINIALNDLISNKGG